MIELRFRFDAALRELVQPAPRGVTARRPYLLMPWLAIGSGWPMSNAATPVYNTLKPGWIETTGGRRVCISALYVDVTRRVHRRPQ